MSTPARYLTRDGELRAPVPMAAVLAHPAPLLLRVWNRYKPSPIRRAEARRIIRQNLTARPQGKGNRFWRRYLDSQAGLPVLIWPDYAVNPIPYHPRTPPT